MKGVEVDRYPSLLARDDIALLSPTASMQNHGTRLATPFYAFMHSVAQETDQSSLLGEKGIFVVVHPQGFPCPRLALAVPNQGSVHASVVIYPPRSFES